MDFDLDPFADILPGPAPTNARAGGKFQPKAKPRPRKVASTSVPSTVPNANKEKPVTLTSTVPDTTQSVRPVDIVDNRLTDPVDSSLASSDVIGTTEPLKSNGNSLPGVPISDDNGISGLVNPSSQLVAAREDMGSAAAPHSEVAMFDGNGDWHSSFGKSAGENADIFFGLESLDDFLSQPTTATVNGANMSQPRVDMNAQAGNKFITSYPVNTGAEGSLSPSEVPDIHASNTKDTEEATGIPVLSAVDDSAFRVSNADPSDTYPEHPMSQDPVICSEAAVSNNDGDFHIDNGRLETEEAEAFPCLETLDIMSEAPVTFGQHTGKFIPKPRVQTEGEKPVSSIPHPDAVGSVSCPRDAHLVPSETEYMDEGSIPDFPPDDVIDFSSMRFGDSIPTDPTSELPVSEEPTNLAETSYSDAVIPGDMHSGAVPEMPGNVSAKSRKRKTPTVSDLSRKPEKSATAGEENKAGKSSMRLRKRVAAHQLVDESEDEADDNGAFSDEPLSNSVIDEDENYDDENRVENTSRKKRVSRKSKKPVAENEKPVRKRKKANEVPNQSSKEPPKKFSHSTRRNKRQVDKVLLETPEDEINLQKLPIKDLIQLAEFKERMSNKEATTLKTPLTNKSTDNSFPEGAPYNEEETFDSSQGRGFNDDQESPRVQSSSSYTNYQSYMDKTPSARWSKQDTELFYEAVRQFGTDFSMIQQLFPNRTRNQVKLKYKKEDRRHTLRLFEAVSNRAKDHSHFELVIKRLQQVAAQAEQNSNGDDSIGVTGEEGEDEETPETNEEAAKSERNEEERVVKDLEADVPEVHSPVKSDESNDDLHRWSRYKSEL